MRKTRIRWGRIIIAIVVVIIIIIAGVKVRNNIIEKRNMEEKAAVETYVACLKENWTQRDYCAKQQHSNYYYLDLLLEKHGYTYKQVGYDLYVVEK